MKRYTIICPAYSEPIDSELGRTTAESPTDAVRRVFPFGKPGADETCEYLGHGVHLVRRKLADLPRMQTPVVYYVVETEYEPAKP